MMRQQRQSARCTKNLLLVMTLLATAVTIPAGAGLLEYVKKPDSAFAWNLEKKIEHAEGTVYALHLVSQVWQDIKWEHQLQIYQPKDTPPRDTMLLMNTGGSAGEDDMKFGMQLASMVKAPIAVLYHIPNQPLLGDRTEDALIAETFIRYLDTKDENWPLLFPMAKSVVRAMDAIQAFSKQEWKKPTASFIITGGSKRGWTSWMTGAADSRVKAIAPLVIDTLNMREQMDHQLESFGAYSEQIADYTERGLVPIPDTPEADRLWRMVDPYTHRDRLTMPKFLINGTNDPYWTVDALNLYWDGLKGGKWALYVPNAGHGLEQHYENEESDRKRALAGLAAFARHQIAGKPLPKLEWKHLGDDSQPRLLIQSDPAPEGARLWVAKSPTRDFRQARWTTQAMAGSDNGNVIGRISPPNSGWVVFYGEVDYRIGDLSYHLSTQVRVIGKPAE